MAQIAVNARLRTFAGNAKKNHQHRVEQNLAEYQQNGYAGILHADYDRQYYNPHDIVDDRCTEDGTADLAVQLAHLPQSLYCNADRGCRQYHTDKDCLENFFVVIRACFKIEIVCHRTADQRDQHADGRNDNTGNAVLFELLHIGIQSGCEHQQNDTDLRSLFHKVGLCDPIQTGRTDQHTCQKRAYDLRHIDFIRYIA